MSWFDDLASAAGNFGSWVGQSIDAFTGKGAVDAQRDANAQNLALTREQWAREDNAIQRRAADMSAAGINPLLAAGSPAAASAPARMEAAGPAGGNPIGAVLGAFQGVTSIAKSLADAQLVRAQTTNTETSTIGGDLANKLAADTLWAKKFITMTDATNAGLSWASKMDDDPDSLRRILTVPNVPLSGFSDYIAKARAAIKADLVGQGFSSESKGFRAAMDALEAKWAAEADRLGAGTARGLGNWVSPVLGAKKVVE